ncbi:MAG: hypothetical protein ACOCV2_06795 [Persicimonas sp.]
MSFTEDFGSGGFAIDLGETTEVIGRFHRKLMDGRSIDWDAFELERYDEELREQARREWATRAVAEYYSTSQFSQLTHRLCRAGAPVELIGASTRLATDECRHAELCARVADLFGGRDDFEVEHEPLSKYDDLEDRWLAIAMTILELCCFGETISVPILRGMQVVSNDVVIERVAEIIASDEGYHMNFGWEALEWLVPRLDDEQRAAMRDALPELFANFEHVCGGGPDVLEELAGYELVVEEDTEPNPAVLTQKQYAGMFYHCVDQELMPRLNALGFDATSAWAERFGGS